MHENLSGGEINRKFNLRTCFRWEAYGLGNLLASALTRVDTERTVRLKMTCVQFAVVGRQWKNFTGLHANFITAKVQASIETLVRLKTNDSHYLRRCLLILKVDFVSVLKKRNFNVESNGNQRVLSTLRGQFGAVKHTKEWSKLRRWPRDQRNGGT